MNEQAHHSNVRKGMTFLVLTILFAGFLLSCGSSTAPRTASPAKTTPTSSKTTPTAATIPTVKPRMLPTSSATPISASITSQNSVQMAIVDGVAYVGTLNNAFYALRASGGALLWRAKIDGAVDEPPLVADGVVYVSTYVGQSGPANIYALQASDGKQLWKYNTGNDYYSMPVAANGLAYIDAPDGVVALRANDGTQAWHFAAGSNTSVSSVVNGVLYLSSYEGDNGPGAAYALRASDGNLLWSYKSAKALDPPTVINGVAYIGTWNGTLYALQASNGKLLWHTALSGALLWSQQVNDVLYIATQKITYPAASNAAAPAQALAVHLFFGMMAPVSKTIPLKQVMTSLYAIQTGNGTILWRKDLNNGQDSFADWFQVDNGVIYGNENDSMGTGSNQGYIYALRSSDGSPLWRDKPDSSVSSEQFSNGVIYFSSGNGSDTATLYALRGRDGTLLWNYPLAAGGTDNSIQIGNVLYVGADNGIIYALSADGGKLLWHYQTAVGA